MKEQTEKKDPVVVTSGQMLMFEQFRLLKKTWWWILLIAVLATAGVWYYVTYHVEPEFEATAVAVPPRKSSTPLDNLLGDMSSGLKSISLSKIIGRKGSEGGYSTYSILSGNAIRDSLIRKYELFDVYDIPRERIDQVYGELDGNVDLESDLEGPFSVSVYDTDPQRAADMANDIVNFTNSLLRELNRLETEPISEYIEGRYDSLRTERNTLAREMEEFMGETSLYEPEAQLSASASALIEARVEESTQRALVNMLIELYGREDPITLQQKELLQQYVAERKKLESGGPGIGPSTSGMPSALMEYTRLRQNYEVNAELLALVEPMYQQAQFDENRDIPQLLFIHEATAPPVKARPKRSLALASAFVGTLFISYIIIAVIAYVRSFAKRYQSYTTSTSDRRDSGMQGGEDEE